jgi:signal transduction histidine kinase
MPASCVPIEQVGHDPADPTRANCPTLCGVETIPRRSRNISECPRRTRNSYYNSPMNLRVDLLIRMTVVGTLCWLAASAYLVAQSGQREAQEVLRIADQIRPIMTWDVMRRFGSVDTDARYPDLGGAASRFPNPVCLRYRAKDGETSDWGCGPSEISSDVPRPIAHVLRALGPGHISVPLDVTIYGGHVGTLVVESNDESLLTHQWRGVRELLAFTAVTVLVLALLGVWAIGHALQPTARIVEAVAHLGEGASQVRLPMFRPREFGLIASGINELAERLARANAAREALTARLIRLQEDERREIAHELHEEFGQCVAELSAVSASLRQSAIMSSKVTEADVVPLELGIEQMLSSLRGMLKRMSLPPLAGQGLRSALADLIPAWQIRLHGGSRVVLDADADTDRIPNGDQALCAYRVVQECLSNVARHAPRSPTATVYVRRKPDGLFVRVSNEISGNTASDAKPTTGMGLRLMDERVRSLGGTFSVETSTVEFVVEVRLPLATS